MQSEIMPVYRDHECPADDALRDSLGCVRPRRAALQPASSRRRWAIARWTSSNDPRSPCTAVKGRRGRHGSPAQRMRTPARGRVRRARAPHRGAHREVRGPRSAGVAPPTHPASPV